MSTGVKALDLVQTVNAYHAPMTVFRSSEADIIHVSGQVGATKEGFVPADYKSQIHLALFNLRKVILIAEAKVQDIAKLTIFVVGYDPRHRKHVRPITRFLRGHRPAMSLVPVPQLANPAWLFEIEAVLARPFEVPSIPRFLQASISPPEARDVVIIGAGLAGLTAANSLAKKGISCVVLESRDRVGGKTWSRPFADGGVFELGAAWINDTNQTHMIGLARQLGLELIEQNTEGDCALEDVDGNISAFSYGQLPKFGTSVEEDVARIRDTVEVDCQKLSVWKPEDTNLDAITFESYLRALNPSNKAFLTATVWTRAMLGVEPSDISALHFLNYCRSGGGLLQMRSDRKGGAQALRVRKGMLSFSTGLAEALVPGTVRLNTAVAQVIHHEGDLVQVRTLTGSVFTAKKLITTVPSPALQNIQFLPRLPPLKRAIAESANYGYYTKVMLVFKTPFWVAKGFCGLSQSFVGPASVIRDTSSPDDDKHVLTCFVAGLPGKAWSEMPPAERESKLLAQVGRLFAAEEMIRQEFLEMHLYEWNNDVWAGYGCPCASLPPGVLDAVGAGALRNPSGNIHFAGTETAGEWKGYMEGAVRSGERASQEVVKQLDYPTLSRL